MKRLLLLPAILSVLAGPALAQSSAVQPNSDAHSTSGASVNVQGDTVYAAGKTKSRIASTASAVAPGLTAAGVHSCAGSASIGGSGIGFNFGVGSTYEMQECNRRA